MRALDSGSGENVMEWCVGSSGVGKKSHVEVQHAQETVELTGTVLMMSYSFFQRVGTLGRYLITKEQ
jgi:hypothetical protein